MPKKRITTTTITHEIIRIKSSNGTVSVRCQQCGARAPMVTAEQAMAITEVNSRTIYQWIENRYIHHFETPEGLILVCLDSLKIQEKS